MKVHIRNENDLSMQTHCGYAPCRRTHYVRVKSCVNDLLMHTRCARDLCKNIRYARDLLMLFII